MRVCKGGRYVPVCKGAGSTYVRVCKGGDGMCTCVCVCTGVVYVVGHRKGAGLCIRLVSEFEHPLLR